MLSVDDIDFSCIFGEQRRLESFVRKNTPDLHSVQHTIDIFEQTLEKTKCIMKGTKGVMKEQGENKIRYYEKNKIS